jgi:hypothetical protein
VYNKINICGNCGKVHLIVVLEVFILLIRLWRS